jgi:hypothetical protein
MGHFQFIKMPFGLKNGPTTYQRYIDVVLMGLKGINCSACLEDVRFSTTMEKDAKKLRAVFERLEKTNFKISNFATDTVENLGHICRPEGIRPDLRLHLLKTTLFQKQ